MAPIVDHEASSLLCAEEDTSIFNDDVGSYAEDFEICDMQYSNRHNQFKDRDFNGGVVFSMQMQSDKCVASMIDKETRYLPGLDYLNRLRSGILDLGARNQAILWIHEVQSHYNFGPLCLYLSINYLDRFLSVYELPGKAWMMQLLAVACLSLAAKMEETEVPLSLDLQVGETKFVFEGKTIQRMELLVLSTLKWRMQSVTPFAYIDYFLYKINGDQMPGRNAISECIQLILGTIKGIDFLEFRASEIAGAVAICVTEANQIVENPDKTFSFLSHHIHKERLSKCVEWMYELKKKNGTGAELVGVPQSPNGVLDAACLSFQSEEDASTTTTTTTTTPSSSCPNSTHNSPAPPPKRRKLHSTFY